MAEFRDWFMLIICLALAVILPWQILIDDSETQDTAPDLNITEIKIAASASPDAIISRQLFSSTRGAVSEVDEIDDLGQDAPAPIILPQEPKLVGIARGRGRSVAIVRGQDGVDQNLKPGENVNGWTLIFVASNSATFSAEGVRKIIALDYSNAP